MDKDVALRIVRRYAENVQYLPKKAYEIREVALAAVTIHGCHFINVPHRYRGERDFVLAASRDAGRFTEVPEQFLDDREVVLAILSRCGRAYHSLPMKMRQDMEYLMTAIKSDGTVISSVKYHNLPREFLLAAATDWGNVLRLIPGCTDREIVLAAVRNDGSSYVYVTGDLALDPEIIVAAVTCKPSVFIGLPEPLRDDREIAWAAVGRDAMLLNHAGPNLVKDLEFVRAVVGIYGGAFRHVAKELMNNKELAILALENDGYEFSMLGDGLQHDRDVALVAASNMAGVIKHTPWFNDDEEIVTAAVSYYGTEIQYASQRLKNRRDLVKTAILSSNGYALKFAGAFADDRELNLLAIERFHVVVNNHQLLDNVSARLLDDRGFRLEALSANGSFLSLFPDLADDREAVMNAVASHGEAYHFASDRLKVDRRVFLTAIETTFTVNKIVDHSINFIRRALRVRRNMAWTPPYWHWRLAPFYPNYEPLECILMCHARIRRDRRLPTISLDIIFNILGMIPWRELGLPGCRRY